MQTSLFQQDSVPEQSVPLRFRSYVATDLDAVVAVLSRMNCPLVSDLTLGAWRGHQIASEMLEQLGKKPLSTRAVLSNSSYSDLIGALIDAETAGDSVVHNAYHAAASVLEGAKDGKRSIAVLAPRSPQKWGRDNILFMQFLAVAASEVPIEIILLFTQPEFGGSIPNGWHIDLCVATEGTVPIGAGEGYSSENVSLWVDFYPGVLSASLMSLLGCERPNSRRFYAELSEGFWLIAPERRGLSSDATSSAATFFQSQAPGWLRAYATAALGYPNPDLQLLRSEAWIRFAEGSVELALLMLERAVEMSCNDVDRAVSLVQLQGLRVAAERFVDLVNEELPANVPLWAKWFLLQTRGWGLVMQSRPIEAASDFEESLTLVDISGDERAIAYLRNIYALAKLRSGDFDGALELERRIEADWKNTGGTDWHVRYVNCLNTGRLYSRVARFEEAEKYFNAAFETASGVRTESDELYHAICLARVLSPRSTNDGLVQYLRACLVFLASDVPDAIAPRVARSIVGPSARTSHAASSIERALFDLLYSSALADGRYVRSKNDYSQATVFQRPRFTSCNAMRNYDSHTLDCWAIGSDGWGVLFLHEAASVQAGSSTRFYRLEQLVWELLVQLARITDVLPGKVVVDRRFGLGIPRHKAELIDLSVRVGASRVVFSGISRSLTDIDRRAVVDRSIVSISPAVSRVELVGEHLLVRFRRYMAPVELTSGIDAVIIRAAQRSLRLGELSNCGLEGWDRCDLLPAIRKLEGSHILVVGLPLEEFPEAY